MKIALVIERMDTSRGGRETSTAQIAQEFARRGRQVTILCQSGSWQADGVEVCPLGSRGVTAARRLKNFAAAVEQHVGRPQFDIVHAMLPLRGANVYQPRSGTVAGQQAAAAIRRGTLGRALAVAGRTLNPLRREMARLERQLAADPAVACLCVSQMVAEEFHRYYGRTAGVRVVYNAVDIPDAAESQRTAWREQLRGQLRVGGDETLFLTVATNFALKGVGELLHAFAALRAERPDAGCKLVVLGGRRYADRYHRQADKLALGQHVVFVPPTQDVFRWYSAADAVVLLSWYDPCSRVVLEAVRWGLPAVTTACNGAAEALAGGGGIVVPSPRDQAAVVRAMVELCEPARREQCRAACLAQAGRLSIERHVDELLAVYDEVVKSK